MINYSTWSGSPNCLIKNLPRSHDNHNSLKSHFYNNFFKWFDILVWFTGTSSILVVKCEGISYFEIVPENFLLTLGKTHLLENHLPRDGKLTLNRHTGIPGFWTQVLDAGLWDLHSGHWTWDAGPCTLGSGYWAPNAWQWMLDPGRRTLNPGCWTMHFGRLALTLDPVVDCFRTESEPSLWFCLIKLLKILWVRFSKVLMVMLVLD